MLTGLQRWGWTQPRRWVRGEEPPAPPEQQQGAPPRRALLLPGPSLTKHPQPTPSDQVFLPGPSGEKQKQAAGTRTGPCRGSPLPRPPPGRGGAGCGGAQTMRSQRQRLIPRPEPALPQEAGVGFHSGIPPAAPSSPPGGSFLPCPPRSVAEEAPCGSPVPAGFVGYRAPSQKCPAPEAEAASGAGRGRGSRGAPEPCRHQPC